MKTRTKRAAALLLMLALLAPLAAWAQSRDCNGPIAIATDAPYTQGFEDGVIPDCWDVYPTTGDDAPSVSNIFSHSGSYSLRFTERGYAVLPEFSNPLDELQISFWSRNTGQLQLGYITAEDDGTCNTFTAIADYTESKNWVQYTNYLLNVPATAHRLAFKTVLGLRHYYFDDVEVSVIPLGFCYPVGNLGLGRVASNSAYLSWELMDNNQTAWDVQVATDANFTENVANLEADSHENYLVESLDPDTYYYVRVKPSCSDDLWSSTVQFWTMPPCNGPITVTADAPYTEGFENPEGTHENELGRLPACWESYTTSIVGPHNTTPHSSWVHGGTQSLLFIYNYTSYAILPEFSNSLNELQISFWLRCGWGRLQLGYLTADDEGNCNTFTTLADFDGPYHAWTQHIFYLLNVPDTAHRLAFKWSGPYDCSIDDLEVSICTLDCFPVGNLSVDNLSSTSACLSWELFDDSQEAWNVQLATDAAFSNILVDEETDNHENYLLEGLSVATQYYVRVKPTCNTDLWNTIGFTTLCGSYEITLDAPYTQGFESPEGGPYNFGGPLPDCWQGYRTSTEGIRPHNSNNWHHDGLQSLAFYSYGDPVYAILPHFSNPLSDLQISFWMMKEHGTLVLGYLTDEDDGTCNTFTEIADYGSNFGSMVQRTTYLPNVPATAHHLAFKWSSTSNYYCFVDDVEVTVVPPDFCYPVGIVSVDDLSSASAYLSWDLIDNSQTAWNVQVATNAAFTNILVDEETDSHENYLLEGLSPGTYYYVRVKPTCNTDLWNVIGFTTLCEPYEITLDAPYTQGFESPEGTLWTQQGPLPPCWEGYNNTVNPAPHNTIGSEGAPNYVHSGAQSMSFYNGGDAYAVLPEFSNPINGLQISFWMRTAGFGSGQLRLGYLTAEDDGTCNTFTEIADYGSNFGSMVQRSTTLENVPATAHRLAFKWSSTSNFRCFVDDVTVSINLEMIPPRDIAVGNITPHEADITWKGACDSYALRYREVPLLFGEGFERVTIPQGWSIEGDNTDPIKTWRIGVGDYHTSVGDGSIGAHSGHYNALITHGYLDAVTYFVTPAFNLTGQTNLTLSFWYVNRKRGNVTDELAVCYRIGNEGEWNELWSTTENHEAWTNQTIALTGLANNYQIGFRCTDHCGWGVGLDDITTNINIVPEWTTVSEAESPCTLTGLTPETDYEVQVKSNCAGYEDWSEAVGFTTYEVCPVPFNMAASSVTATGATLAWTGFSDSYNVRYRTAVQDSFSEDFEGEDVIAPGNWTFISKNIGNGIGGNGEHPAGIFAFGDDGAYSPVHGGEKAFRFSSYSGIGSEEAYDQYLVSPELSVTGTLKFYHRKYNDAVESLQVGYSTTTNDVETEGVFTWTEVALGTSWQEYTLALPDDVKYIAFHYYGYCSYCVYLDDIIIDDWVPAGEWDSEEGILSGLQPNMPYEWQAQGVCDGEATGWSASAYFTTEEGITLTKDITGYGTGAGGYYLIASPVMEDVTPTAENGFLTNAFDLYYFDHDFVSNEWQNYKVDTFNLVSGKGYLYASQESTTLIFSGTPHSATEPVEVALDYNDAVPTFGGWNLVGNPFAEPAFVDLDFYTMNSDGTEIIASTSTTVEAMEGIFVIAEGENETVTFTKADDGAKGANLVLNISYGRGIIDRAIVHFDSHRTLPKFQLNPNNTKVYIPQGGKDYAVVNVGRDAAHHLSTMDVNFKAAKNGTYTLTFDMENVAFDYLHLIDNLTGADVDLLAVESVVEPVDHSVVEPVETPTDNNAPSALRQVQGPRTSVSYTFTAKTTDYASRFKLVFVANDGDGPSTSSGSFAYISNGNIVINGEGTLQVIDMMGRVIRCTDVARNVSTSGLPAGVYVLRLIDGKDVMIQKIVIE